MVLVTFATGLRLPARIGERREDAGPDSDTRPAPPPPVKAQR